jgi:hypothetical protein
MFSCGNATLGRLRTIDHPAMSQGFENCLLTCRLTET